MYQETNTVRKPRKTIHYYMRLWHNYIGYFIAGLVIIYGLSGIVQTYRDTDFLKQEVIKQKTEAAHLTGEELGKALQIKEIKINKTEADLVFFKEGTYNTTTGEATITTKELYPWIAKLTKLHKSNSKAPAHLFTTVFGVLMLFMSVSAFWMFKPGTKLFSRGVFVSAAGIVAAIILMLL